MSNQYFTKTQPAVLKVLSVMLLAAAILVTAGCDEPDNDEGVSISAIPLSAEPADLTLNLNCADVGVYVETCVLDDPENPWAEAGIVQFNEDDPESEAFNKFELANGIPSGPAGAKSRFYYWATALAQRPEGENQYFAARALHEVYAAQAMLTGFGDPIVRDQALKAYQSLLDNFFGSIWFAACFFNDGVFQGCPPPDGVADDDVAAEFGLPLNEFAACSVYFKSASVSPEYPSGFERLVTGDELGCDPNDQGCLELATLDLFTEWGYAYIAPEGGDCIQGVVVPNP